MDFSETYRQNLVEFSADNQFILTALQQRVIIRSVDTLAITRTLKIDATPSASQALLSTSRTSKPSPSVQSTESWITQCSWSSDSECILAACAKKGTVHVFSLSDEEWNARIDCGAEGLVKAEWAPDAKAIICFSEWGLRVTLWSLVTGAATYIQYPVHPDRGYAFGLGGQYFVLAERHKSKDTLGVYSTSTSDGYKLVRHFPLPTSSLSSISLSPSAAHVAVWEGPLEVNKLHILNVTGKIAGSFTPEIDPGFGIRDVLWHPKGNMLAVSGWDDKIYILDGLTWSPIAILELSSRIPAGVTIWREPSNWLEATEGRGFLSYERIQSPHSIVVTRTDSSKLNPKSGVVQMNWNTAGNFLLVRFENTPTVIHIFQFMEGAEPKLRTILLHTRPVLQARWKQNGGFALCCGSRSVYTWSADEWEGESGKDEEIAECIGIPANLFDARDLKWSTDGKGLLLLDKDTFCCAFEIEDM